MAGSSKDSAREGDLPAGVAESAVATEDEEDEDRTVETPMALEPGSKSGSKAAARSPTPSPGIPLSVPRAVEIHTLTHDDDDESLDETKVKIPTKPGGFEEEPVTALDVKAPPRDEDEDEGEALTVMNTRVDDPSSDPTKPAEVHPVDALADDSITTQAPAHVSEKLRAISKADAAPPDEEDSTGSRTAVMVGAPVQPLSDSALSIASPGPPGERAEIDVLGPTIPHPSAMAAAPPLDLAPILEPLRPMGPSHHPVRPSGGPRYGPLVAAVAIVSIIVPLVLFFVLSRVTGSAGDPGVVREATSNTVPRGDVLRSKATKPSPSASASASASASSSATKPPVPAPRWPPHH